MTCAQCGRPVCRDEAGLSRKLINRGTDKLYCYGCLSRMFHIDQARLVEMAESFRAAGCTLFK